MNELKTLHIIGSKTLGGAERSFSRIVGALNRAGVHAEGVMRSGSSVPDILPQGVTTHELPLRTVWDPLSRFEVSRLIRETKPDIVQTYMGRATRLTHLPADGKPIHVARLCGNYRPEHFAHAHAWVACTKWVADYLLAGGIPAKRLSIIPNFLPATPPATPDELAMARARWQFDKDDLIVGAIGRLQHIKGFDTLIQAFARLPREIDGRRPLLAIAGEGELAPALAKLATELGLGDRVRLLGWTKRPDLLLRLADVVAFTSRPNEGFGNVTLEAWEAGTPLVTTRSKGALETSQHLDTAWQVPCDDPIALADALLSVLQDRELGQRLAAAGRTELAHRYSEEAVICQFVELYNTLTH